MAEPSELERRLKDLEAILAVAKERYGPAGYKIITETAALRARVLALETQRDHLLPTVERAKARWAVLREATAYYATPEAWRRNGRGELLLADEGALARKALAASDSVTGAPYLAISAGDGQLRSVICPSLDKAIEFIDGEFNPEHVDGDWIGGYVRDKENWADNDSRVRWDGEQCCFEIIAITGG